MLSARKHGSANSFGPSRRSTNQRPVMTATEQTTHCQTPSLPLALSHLRREGNVARNSINQRAIEKHLKEIAKG